MKFIRAREPIVAASTSKKVKNEKKKNVAN